MTSLKPLEPIKVKLTSRETDQAEENIRRDIEHVVNTVRLTPVVGRRQQQEYLKCNSTRKRLMRTPVTEHTPGVTMAATWAGQIDKEAFRALTKIPSLRASPATIRWPVRGPMSKYKPKPKVLSLPDLKKNAQIALEQRPRKAKLPKQQVFDENDEDFDEEDEEDMDVVLAPWKPVPYANFWDTAYGNIRIDRHCIGSPYVDPHHSTWTPDARRCYFVNRPQPLHYRSQALRKMPSDLRPSFTISPYSRGTSKVVI